MYPHLKRQQTPPRSYPGGREDLKGEISYPGERHSLLTNIRKTPSPQKPYRGRLRQRRGRKVAVSSKVVAEWRRGETEDADVSMNDNSARVEEQWDNWEPEVGGESAGIEIGVSDERASFVASEDADASFEDYVLLVESGSLKFIRIARYIYVVQGWNARQREPTKHFYHLESRNVGSKLELTCLCPDGDKNELCVHRLFYVEFRDERFRRDEDLWFREGKTVMFWRQMTGDEDVWLNRFSVQSHGGGLKGRAIVTYEGLDNGQGTWRCARDRSRCEHIGFARAFLREVLRISEEAEQEWDDGDVGDTQGAEGYMLDDLSGGQHEERSVSYLPIMPPKWAQLPSDTVHYIRTNPNTEIPALIQLLAGQGRSACKAHVEYNPNLGKFVRECTVYGLVGSVSRSIEVQHCSVCPPRRHCLVGPDPRSLGLFNYNNSALFTHELLDEYTNRFTRSVTPFTAFTEAMAAVYESRGSKFVGEDLLREAWFAYASIQDLAKDMVCPQCGTEPENMIFDGVTSGFNKKHLNDGLCPPTHEHDDAPVRDRRYPVKPQWLPATARGKTVRSRLADWVRQNKSRRGSITSVGGEDLGLLVADLTREALPLGNLFKHVFFSPDENRKHDVDLRQRYLCLFEQLAGEESAVQMVNEQAVALMKALVACPTVYNASCLVEVPAVLMVLEAEMRVFQGYTSTMMAVCSWMINRVEEVLSDLKKGSIPPLPLLEHSEVGDWQRVGDSDSTVRVLLRVPRPDVAMGYRRFVIVQSILG
ncbi:hypothetical protein VNI00_017739 [Paramarasmius palmivorus]|uniref:HMG domain-containing protein n=1 Tax=Paramarasmius palmivorus TaxID=297713 RepID=A0AAW0B3G7_9AGAR